MKIPEVKPHTLTIGAFGGVCYSYENVRDLYRTDRIIDAVRIEDSLYNIAMQIIGTHILHVIESGGCIVECSILEVLL